MVGYAGSSTYTAYVDMTLTRFKVKVTGLLNFRQLAKPCMLAAMTAAPLRGFLVIKLDTITVCDLVLCRVLLQYVTVALRLELLMFVGFSCSVRTHAIKFLESIVITLTRRPQVS